jgi:rod shape-determining protein MreD
MAYLIGIPILVILAIVQATVLSNMRLLDGAPDLILLASVAWALTGHPRQAMTGAMIGGLLIDLLSGLPLGLTAIMMVLIVYLVSLTAGRFWEAHLLMPLTTILWSSLLYHGLSLAILLALGRSVDLGFAVGRVILPSTFLNLILALPATQAAGSLAETLYPPEVQI